MATSAAKSTVQPPAGGQMSDRDFQALLTAGTDEVFKRGFETPFQGDMFYEDMALTKQTHTTQTTVGMGNIGRNDDGETIRNDSQSLGFAHSMSSIEYRGKAEWTRKLLEDELYGQLTDNSVELMQGANRTVEEIMADGINRGLGAAGTAHPFLCEDGLGLIASGRPNPHPLGGTWSNLESTAAISPSSIFTAMLAFRAHKNERGQKNPLRMTTMYIRPQDEAAVVEALNSQLRPTDSMNAVNHLAGRGITYMIYDYMSSAYILYKGEGAVRNELKSLWRVRPTVDEWPKTDTDVFAVRVRFRYGVGCGRPDCFRGGIVS